MKKNLVISALFGVGFVSTVFAETQILQLQKGWNLKGTYLDGVSLDNFVNNNVKTIWKWEDGKWAVWSSDPQIQKLIQDYIDKGVLKQLSTLNSGDGFWVLSTDQIKIVINGFISQDTTLKLEKGWNLVALKGLKSISISELSQYKNIITVWKWVDGKWAVWSPYPQIQEIIDNYVAKGLLEKLQEINPGEGFWIYVGEAGELEGGTLETPPSVGIVYVLKDPLNAEPLKGADVYVNGKYIGKTTNSGEFDTTGLKDGDIVVIKKPGIVPAVGIVKNGSVVILTQKDNPNKTPLTSSEENIQKPINKVISSPDGSVALIISKYKGEDITVSVVPVISTMAVPPIEAVYDENGQIATDETGLPLSPENLAIIGGAQITVEDANGNILSSDQLDSIEISYQLKISKFLGDLEDLLNGNTNKPSQNYQKFSETVYNKLNELVESGQIDFVILQFLGNKWVYKGKGTLKAVTLGNKESDGNVKEYTKYILESNEPLDKLATTVVALKLNYLIGETKVCVTEGGYKMFDGSIVTASDSNSPNFEWIGKPIYGVTVLGDNNVQNGPFITDANGCVTVKYKVPFVKPTFSLAFKKNGYFDNSITCEVTAEGAFCPEAKLYRIPDTASIEGYVLNKVTKEGIPNALVTLVNPEVLSANKVEYGTDENGNAYVKVGYMPNVEYTWTAVKYDEKGNKVAEVIIKQGKGDPEYAKLTEGEIMNILIKPLDEGNEPPIDPKYLLGKWELHVKAVHTFTNTSQKLVEEAVGSFDLDILMPKLAEIMGGQISEKLQEVVVGDNGTLEEVPASLKNAAIYGGPSVGFLYEYGAQLDEFEWKTQILGAGVEDITGCIDDPIANEYGECYIDIANETLVYKKALYPISLNVQFMAKHFADLLKPDPACVEGEDCYGKPLIKTGFTIRTLFEGSLYLLDNSTLTKLVATYVDVPTDLDRKIQDLVDIPDIKLVGPSVTAYMRQVITKDNGYYRINMIPPELNGKLELFAKAEGYKFDVNTDIKLVNDLAVGKVSHYDLELEPIATETQQPPVQSIGWDGWQFENNCNVDSVQWQIVQNPENIKVSNSDWALTVWGTETVTLLPDKYIDTSGYLWFGDKNTGLFSDTGNNYSSGAVCGSAISPVIDLSQMAFPVLKFLSWFEVESVDVAKYMFDQMEIGFIIPKEENGNKDTVKIYTSTGEGMELQTDTYYPITLLNPNSEPSIQDPEVPYSNQGANAIPIWQEFTVPVEALAGYKVRFVFKFNSVDGLFNGFRGWGIDKVEVIDSLNETLAYPPQLPVIENVNFKVNREVE